MYIAIIADNIATRKHMERLLNRTSDAIMSQTGNLYIEAYGDPKSMWPLIKRYDLFFLDITQDEELKDSLIQRFTELDLTSQTVICQAQDTDFSYWPAEHGFLSVQHPLSVPILSGIIQEIHNTISQNQASKKIIEFRSEDKTEYIEAEQVLYARENEHLVEVHLLDDSVVRMLGNLFDFARLVENYEEFEMYGKEVVVNKNYVTKTEGRKITLSNHQTIKLSLFKKHLF